MNSLEKGEEGSGHKTIFFQDISRSVTTFYTFVEQNVLRIIKHFILYQEKGVGPLFGALFLKNCSTDLY